MHLKNPIPFQTLRPTRWPVALSLLLLTVLHCGGKSLEDAGGLAEQLWLSPSNPQAAQGTAQQFTLRSLSASGPLRDLTRQAKWLVTRSGGGLLASSTDGLLELAEPGRYQVTAEYGAHRLTTVITVTAATLTSLAIGPTLPKVAKGLSQSFSATAHFSDGTTQDVTRSAAWSVKDTLGTSVASVNTLGVATAKNVGKARVSVRYQTITTSTTLEVTAATLAALAVSPSNPTLVKGSSQAFAASATYSDGSVHDVTADADWAVADLVGSGVAAVDGAGVVTGQAVGQATVSAAYSGLLVETRLTVAAATLVSLAVSPSTASLVLGTTQRFVATATFSDGSTQDVTETAAWASTDLVGTGVAAVTSTGIATGHAVGTATIACSYRSSSATATLAVTPAVLTGLALQPAAATIAKGLTQQFVVMGSYSDGSQHEVSTLATWAIADVVGTGVASVTAAGLAVGKNVGKANLSATYLGQGASGVLTVTAATLSTLAITPASPVLDKGGTQQFKALGRLSDGSTQDLTNLVSWTATDLAPASGVATIGASGLATANKEGQATIAAQYLGLSDATVLTVQVHHSYCSEDGWCMRNPSPGPNRWMHTLGLDANNVWAVGEQGAIAKWNGTRWDVQAHGTDTLYGIWASDAKNLWAVGYGGTILKWNGATWAAQASGTTVNLMGVWGSDASNVWAVGYGGTILKWNGTAWVTQVSGLTVPLYKIWGSDANNVWAVGLGGVILKWNGTAWAAQASGLTTNVYAIWGSDASNVWAVGSLGTIVKWNGVAWAAQASGVSAELYSVWGSDSRNVWAAGANGVILKWNGTAWITQLHDFGVYNAVWASDANNAWAVSQLGTIVKWNGTAWASAVSGVTDPVNAVWASDANNTWAVSDVGTIMRWDGAAFTTKTTSHTYLNAIWGLDASNIWAVGSADTGLSSVILKWNGTTWAAQPSGAAQDLKSVWGSDASHVWAVGTGGAALKWNGTFWTATAAGTTQHLSSVWGTDANNVWAVGHAGTILKWNGTAWAIQSTGVTTDFEGVWGSDVNNVWAVGTGGARMRWNGTAWTIQGSATNLSGIWGSDANNIWAVGAGGIITRWNGIFWSNQESGTYADLYSVSGTDANNVWIAGKGGLVLQYSP